MVFESPVAGCIPTSCFHREATQTQVTDLGITFSTSLLPEHLPTETYYFAVNYFPFLFKSEHYIDHSKYNARTEIRFISIMD